MNRALKPLGVDREGVLPLLIDGAIPPLRGRADQPLWSCILHEIFAERQAKRWPDNTSAGLACGIMPFVSWAAGRLSERLERLRRQSESLDFDVESILNQFAAALAPWLEQTASRTFILHMYLAKLEGSVDGDNPQQRFDNFVRRELADPNRLGAILHNFPVLARHLAMTSHFAVEAWSETIERLVLDWETVCRSLPPPGATADRLVTIEAGMGDVHCGGRSVFKLGFDSGRMLVYKPRPLAATAHFQDLIRFFNRRGLKSRLRPLRVLDRGAYGWMEYAQAKPLRSKSEAADYYRRQGALLLLVHLLDATDFHMDNVIAAGGHPCLVDVETLFHNVPRSLVRREGVFGVASEVMSQSVIRTGLLPMPTFGPEGSIELSGLAGKGGQKSPFLMGRWTAERTDQMRMIMTQGILGDKSNLPHFDDHVVPVEYHVEDLIDGFVNAYSMALEYRGALLAQHGPLQRFVGDRVRHVVRPTYDYAIILDDSFHPECLRDARDRDFLFSTLWWQVRLYPHLAVTIPSEITDLWNGDVPFFTAEVDGRDLIDSRGTRLPNFFEASGLERVRARVSALSDSDLERQVYCIRTTMSRIRPVEATDMVVSAPELKTLGEDAELVAAACAIGDRLTQLAIFCGQEAYWAGLRVVGDDDYVFAPVGYDLYSGNAGIALFLGYLAQQSGRDKYQRLARAAVSGMRREMRGLRMPVPLGAFAGPVSALYAKIHLARLWDDPSLLDDIGPQLERIRVSIKHDTSFDILSGAAGCIAVLLLLHEAAPRCNALTIAEDAAAHLLRNARPTNPGCGWAAASDSRPLLGFSHGTAGIACALMRLHAVTGQQEYADTASHALAYERSNFDPTAGNWPDFRKKDQDSHDNRSGSFMWGWCHGAPGIALGRMTSPTIGGSDALVRREVDLALASTVRMGLGKNQCLCHGDFGNLDALVVAAMWSNDDAWHERARRHAYALINAHARGRPWRCGLAPDADIPGLMLGLAGIGYGLLRIADPKNVPSVLAVEDARPSMSKRRSDCPPEAATVRF